jgi:hypothetical protein
VSAHAAFNFANVAGEGNTFQQAAPAKTGMTYAILHSSDVVRTLFTVSTVEGCEDPSTPCTIQ